ncbi:MAG: hypothetical protein Q8N21_00480 [bacterium]|nr:hypothetical protein [bacterium]
MEPIRIKASDILSQIGRIDKPRVIKNYFRKHVLPACGGDYENARQAMMFILHDYWRDDIDRKLRIKIWEDALKPFFQKSPEVRQMNNLSAAREIVSAIPGLVANIPLSGSLVEIQARKAVILQQTEALSPAVRRLKMICKKL